jgi:hypothetical protein
VKSTIAATAPGDAWRREAREEVFLDLFGQGWGSEVGWKSMDGGAVVEVGRTRETWWPEVEEMETKSSTSHEWTTFAPNVTER